MNIKGISTEKETEKRIQVKIPELKSTITELENLLDDLTSVLETTEESTN